MAGEVTGPRNKATAVVLFNGCDALINLPLWHYIIFIDYHCCQPWAGKPFFQWTVITEETLGWSCLKIRWEATSLGVVTHGEFFDDATVFESFMLL